MSLTSLEAERKKYCSRECASRGKAIVRGSSHPLYSRVPRVCERCGSTFHAKPAKLTLGEGRFCSRQCVGAYSAALQGGRRSSIEVAIEAELVRQGVPFESQKQFRWYTVDFYLPHLRLVLECDGDYWHSRPQQVAKDRKKDAWLSGCGERIVRLTETEIRASPQEALARALAS
ncbi:endonuclease domain-containing protein [Deinococcus phoenicis]|uniref:endonuclease domain-containing protein n=1 Tax=Deinococcus phoenicis TaxID=1476583 RepID=UPI003899355B